MGAELSKYVKKVFPDSKSDASTVFMERCMAMCTEHGYMTMINIPVWMFLSSYEKLRNKLLNGSTLVNMVHPGRGIFGSDFGSTAFVFQKGYTPNYIGSFRRLFDAQGDVKSSEERERQFLSKKGEYYSSQDDYGSIPGKPIAYWLSNNVLIAFEKGIRIGDISKARRGLETGDNEKYIRSWYEVGFNDIQLNCKSIGAFHQKWIPHNKGGDFRLWYGNRDLVVLFENDGEEIRRTGVLNGYDAYCKKGITWTALTISRNSFRYTPEGSTFDSNKGPLIEGKDNLYYLLGFLNSIVCQEVIKILNPTISLQNGNIDNIPVIFSKENTIENIVLDCVNASKTDWDSFETSWDFQCHPLIKIDRNYALDNGAFGVS